MKKLYKTLLFNSFLLVSASGSAQVVINELSYTNISIPVDENGQAEDWIELFNNGTSAVNLAGYKLVNGFSSSDQYIFPSVTMAPGSHLKLLASGRNEIIGGFHHISIKIGPDDQLLVLKNNMGAVLDQVTIRPELQGNHSIGRKPDGSAGTFFFDTATPGGSNNGAAAYDGYVASPVFNTNGGFFTGPVNFNLTAPASTVVRYTLNGDIPQASSPAFTAGFTINSTKVVSARAFGPANLLPSAVVKKTFIINEALFNVPVFSITTDSINLWDYNTGIYATGPNADTAFPYLGANYWQDWEKNCYVEYFNKSKALQFSSNAGLKIFGGYSRVFAQKSFKIKCRSHYGRSELNFPLIPDKPFVTNYKDIVLRNGGSDNWDTHFRDALMQRLMKKEHVDYMAYEPSAVYLNGQFWGFYEIRERQDEVFLENNHNVPANQLDLIEHSGMWKIIAGSDTGFFNMRNYIVTADKSSPDFYNAASKYLDLENFADYFIAETYYGNTDWISSYVNNVRLWRPHNGRWRYLLWDLDWGLGLFAGSHNNFLNQVRTAAPNDHSTIFNSMLENSRFRNYFINRYADLMNTVYQPAHVSSLAHEMQAEIGPMMSQHFAKWGGDLVTWNQAVEEMITWNETRIGFARDQVQSEFGLAGKVNVSLEAFPANTGKVHISTITPETLPWTGVYYQGVPVTMTALPQPGYIFSHWETPEGEVREQSITRNFSSDENIIAHFEALDFALNVFPSPSNDVVTITYDIPSECKVSIKLYSVLGAEVLNIDNSFHAEGNHSLDLSLEAAGITRGLYFLEFRAGDFMKKVAITKN